MKKVLFIQIDNTSAPIEAENDYIPLECKQINDFSSFVGDALIGDLKDCNGTPLYRLINPAGRLLSDFEKVDKANYDLIIAQWLDILSEILHKGVSQTDEQFTICFQQQYTNWLLNSENDYFVEIGKSLQANDGKVYLDADGISEDIISALRMKINSFLNKEKGEIEYIVFSNERIGNSSHGVKQLKNVFNTCSFLRLDQWTIYLQEELNDRKRRFEDYTAFHYGPFQLGISKKEDFNLSDYGFGSLESDEFHCELKFNSNNICSYIKTMNGMLYGEEKDEYIKNDFNKVWLESLSSICGKEMKSLKQPLAELVVLLYHKGFRVINPYNTGFRHIEPSQHGCDINITFWKDTVDFCCRLSFSGWQISSLIEHKIQMIKLDVMEIYLK